MRLRFPRLNLNAIEQCPLVSNRFQQVLTIHRFHSSAPEADFLEFNEKISEQFVFLQLSIVNSRLSSELMEDRQGKP